MGCGCNSGRNHATATPQELVEQAQARADQRRDVTRQEAASQAAAASNANANTQ